MVVGEGQDYDAYESDLWSAGMTMLHALGLPPQLEGENDDLVAVCRGIIDKSAAWLGDGEGGLGLDDPWRRTLRELMCHEGRRSGETAVLAAAREFKSDVAAKLASAKAWVFADLGSEREALVTALKERGARVGDWRRGGEGSRKEGGLVVGVGEVDLGGADLWVFVGPSVPEGEDDGGEYDLKTLHAAATFEAMEELKAAIIL